MNTLYDIVTSYPHFQPNQLLSSQHLNHFGDYFEQQERLTRNKLIGVGIMCGLNIGYRVKGTSATVTVTGGAGVTSEGHLVCLDHTECTHARPFHGTDLLPVVKFKRYVWEILPKPDDGSDPAIEPLTPTLVNASPFVVLFLEKIDRATDRCIDDGCDQRGKIYEFAVRILLFDTKSMGDLIEKRPTPPNRILIAVLQGLKRPAIPRFAVVKHRLRLDQMRSYKDFVKHYATAIEPASGKLRKALDVLHARFLPLFKTQMQIDANPFRSFGPKAAMKLAGDRTVPVQYVYDWIRDLQATYEELVCKLFQLHSECAPDPKLFPCHLMLGKLQIGPAHESYDPAAFDPVDEYRHSFIPSPIHEHPEGLRQNVLQLIQRLSLLVTKFKRDKSLFSAKQEIRITPTSPCYEPLGTRAIPCYYDSLKGRKPLFKHWDFDAGRRARSGEHLGYEAKRYSEHDHVKNPLRYDICRYPNLRIEGHIGSTVSEATEELQKLRRQFNLDFDIIALKLGSGTHRVYLPDDTMIADLQAQYLAFRNEFVCCVQELQAVTASLVAGQDALDKVTDSVANAAKAGHSVLRTLLSGRGFQGIPQLFLKTLGALVEQLPADLKVLQAPAFYSTLSATNHQAAIWTQYVQCNLYTMAARLRTAAGFWESGITTKKKPRGDDKLADFGLSIPKTMGLDLGQITPAVAAAFEPVLCQYQELIRLIAKVFAGCLRAKLETVHLLLRQRVDALTNFRSFAARYPGMEHIAGTVRGGTFILVYQETKRYKVFRVRVKSSSKQIMRRELVDFDVDDKTFALTTDDDGVVEVSVPEGTKKVTMFRGVNYSANVKLSGSGTETITLGKTTTNALKKMAIVGKVPPARSIAASLSLAAGSLTADVNKLGIPGSENKLLLDLLKVAGAGVVKSRPDAAVEEPPIEFGEREDFKVVGDFYLPSKIHMRDEVVLWAGAVCDGPAATLDLGFESLVEMASKEMNAAIGAIKKGRR